MKAIWTSVAAAGVVVIGLLVYMVIDAAISLDHSRSENQFLRCKCELLVKLADNGLRELSSKLSLRRMNLKRFDFRGKVVGGRCRAFSNCGGRR
jgi:hypothetical protein